MSFISPAAHRKFILQCESLISTNTEQEKADQKAEQLKADLDKELQTLHALLENHFPFLLERGFGPLRFGRSYIKETPTPIIPGQQNLTMDEDKSELDRDQKGFFFKQNNLKRRLYDTVICIPDKRITKLFDTLESIPDILMLGFDGAGKTTILDNLKLGEVDKKIKLTVMPIETHFHNIAHLGSPRLNSFNATLVSIVTPIKKPRAHSCFTTNLPLK